MLVLDAAGKDVILVETVGIGQSEVGVLGSADTVVLVLMPGSGDAIQALKAGVMEIPDVIAVNKRNHPAAKTLVQELRSTLVLERDGWTIPIVLTEALDGEGVAELWAAVERHRAPLEDSGALEQRRRERLAAEVFALASARAKTHLERAVADDAELGRLLDDVEERRLDPLSAVQEVLERVFRIDGHGRADGR
jgi:LAO/AO transport system kinase